MKAKNNQPVLAVTESHTDTITHLAFHVSSPPTHTNVEQASKTPIAVHLISSSTDGLITVFDPSIPDEDDSVMTVLNNRNAIQHFQDFPQEGHGLIQSGHICTISHDEKMSIHSVAHHESETETSDPQTVDLRGHLKCDYVIGLQAMQGGGGLVLAVGALKE